MSEAMSLVGDLDHLRKRCLVVGSIGLVVLVVGLFFDAKQFFQSYLVAYLFVLGPALGSVALLSLHGLTGGGWGYSIWRVLLAGVRTVPALLVAFLPLCFGIQALFHWSHADAVAHDPVLQAKSAYLNVPFFFLRAAIYFVLWFGLARVLSRAAREFELHPDLATQQRLRKLSAAGLLVYVLSMSFAAFDWGMSLEPHWFSHVYGVKMIIGQVLTTWCVMILFAHRLAKFEPFRSGTSKLNFHDLGNLTMAFTLLWAYIVFSEYLIIWSGNLPEETPYYLRRTENGWGAVALFLIVFHFAVPFLVLLARQNKRLKQRLVKLAAGLLVLRAVDLLWLIAPAFHTERLWISWMDVAAFLGLGGLWGWYFLGQLLDGPLQPAPRLVAPIEAEAA
ncbi:MAG: hypothetical protein WD226_07205 [Planctomycetota bacterium]